jgi:hypothetical protein
LGEALLTAAEAEKEALPLLIERPRARLETATQLLADELQPVEQADTGAATAADRVIDDAWRSFSVWLGALAGMPEGTFDELYKIRALHTALFSEGLSFIALSYPEEWTQSETRLKTIAEEGYESMVETLGGAPFLTNLRNAHARYGEVLGITAPIKPEERPEVRAHMLKLTDAIRAYVVKVMAYVDPEEPGSDALAEALLLPLTQWKGVRLHRAAGADTPAGEPDDNQ